MHVLITSMVSRKLTTELTLFTAYYRLTVSYEPLLISQLMSVILFLMVFIYLLKINLQHIINKQMGPFKRNNATGQKILVNLSSF